MDEGEWSGRVTRAASSVVHVARVYCTARLRNRIECMIYDSRTIRNKPLSMQLGDFTAE